MNKSCLIEPLVDGGWTLFGDWTDWSDCSVSCGGGQRTRTHSRTCTNPKPQHGGQKCTGSSKETSAVSCNSETCPGLN